MSKLLRAEALKDLVQETFDRGVTGVERIHTTIADLPFDALERSGKLEEPARAIRDTQRSIIGAVYTTIRRVGKEVGDLTSELIAAVEDHQDADENIRRTEEDRG